ncbi:hypothetical protein ACFU6I_21835 [Streptomyces sp. NPDC057486]|uniref:hypothetical protein n=1 Tax=Streptomyces sp. NPDC057486 TaxID=3346145 RepID=UPI0036840FE7
MRRQSALRPRSPGPSGPARAVIAQEEFAAAPAEARAADGPPPDSGGWTAAAAPGTIVPDWRPGLKPTVLAPDYQRIIGALEAAVREGTGR